MKPDTMELPSDADHTGRDLGGDELALLREVIESGTLNCTKGTQVKAFEEAFAARHGVPHARAVSSGTAACHAAIAAIDPEPGDEIITTSITDMGAIAPILYQLAIPMFADVDPVTLNVTPATVAARITSRTRAIVATHLFGNPCDVAGIVAIASAHGIPVIEDCAQAYLATQHERLVGTIGTIGAFSLQQGKHMTTGEGGVTITADPALARWMTLFSDKAWGYGDPNPDHYFLALNYRMTDLQGAVARAQLAKLDGVVGPTPGVGCAGDGAAVHSARHHAACRPAGRDARVLEVPADRRSGGHHGRCGRARRRAQGAGRVLRPALHPEARLPVRGVHRSQDLRP